jgi:HK97 family phage prohead protease
VDIQYGLAFPVHEVKATGDAWTVEGYASTYGNVDQGGDVVLRGAFDDTLKSDRRVRFLLGHDQTKPLGSPLDLHSDEKGLWGKFKISKTSIGHDVHEWLMDGALDSFSIGYIPTDVEFDGDVRLLKGINLLETSLVAIPMNDQALVTGVKHVEEDKAVWSAAYINDLPDSAFAVILPGGTKDGEGKTTPRSLRKLPHHNADGAVDMPHLRNALSREPQTDMPDAAHSKAKSHLSAHQRGKSDDDEIAMKFDEHLDCVMSEIARLLERTEEIAALRADAGRRLSGAKFEQLKTLRAGVDDLLKLETPTNGAPVQDSLRLRLAIARRRLQARGILEHAS